MQYPKSQKYERLIKEKIMGPNPVKLTEELMTKVVIPKGSLVMDLGSGTGITSVFLAKEYGLRVIAADLWSNQIICGSLNQKGLALQILCRYMRMPTIFHLRMSSLMLWCQLIHTITSDVIRSILEKNFYHL